jgi:sarcosine oxidase subunit gamma
MSDTVLPRSALTAAPRIGSAEGVLAIREHTGSTLLHLEGERPGAELDAALMTLGLPTLPMTGASDGRDGARLLGIGPAIWLLVLNALVPPPTALGAAFDVALDVSHAYTRLAISGSRAADFIAKACALDLHPRIFRPGACAATAFTGMRTILWRTDPDGFDLLVGRSYTMSLWQWMTDAATEFTAGTHDK